MRQIERQMLAAIYERREWKSSNTQVTVVCFPHGDDAIERITVRLHDNLIATITPDYVEICDCGWQSVTTKSRLNALLWELCRTSIYQRNHKWYLHQDDQAVTEMDSGETYAIPRTGLQTQAAA